MKFFNVNQIIYFLSKSKTLLSRRLKFLRLKNKYSQGRLAALTGISRSKINAYERGASQPSINTLISLADVLEVTIDDILTGENSEARISQRDLRTLAENNNALQVALTGFEAYLDICAKQMSKKTIKEWHNHLNILKAVIDNNEQLLISADINQPL